MANSLNIDLTGKKIVVKEKYYPNLSEAERTFTCNGGFGCKPHTMGGAVFGEFADGERCRIEGYEIEKEAE